MFFPGSFPGDDSYPGIVFQTLCRQQMAKVFFDAPDMGGRLFRVFGQRQKDIYLPVTEQPGSEYRQSKDCSTDDLRMVIRAGVGAVCRSAKDKK